MIPPNIASPDVRAYEEAVSDALRSAIEKNSIEYAVVLSSVGAANRMERVRRRAAYS